MLFVGDAGFGIAMPLALAYRARTGRLPMTPWGFRAFEGGPFDRLDPAAFAVLGAALVGVCAADAVAGRWLWRGERRGAVLGLAMTPPAVALGAGYLLPLLLISVPIRLAMVAAAWRGLGVRG
ncbi:MAG: hypothetical protein H0U37_01000 [Chloroflexi bacterium]|nr:hypothetical protein [Chloroflexota bacterium]